MELALAIPLFLCWGSFLNVLAYRLIEGISIVAPRSFCPACRHPIHWYDNLPLISYLLLRGKCRKCHASISWLYFFIELQTAFFFYILFSTVDSSYWFAYTLFFSALIVTIRTDLEHMLISRYMSLYLVPVGIILSWAQLLPITITESIVGTLFGYGLLWLIRRIFYALRKVEGLGIGDAELLAMIGSFCGPLGVWVSLLLGSLLGTLFAVIYLCIKREGNLRSVKIPFGPFLALGAMLFVIFEYEFVTFFLP